MSWVIVRLGVGSLWVSVVQEGIEMAHGKIKRGTGERPD